MNLCDISSFFLTFRFKPDNIIMTFDNFQRFLQNRFVVFAAEISKEKIHTAK